MRYWIVMLWIIVASLPLIAQEDPSPEPVDGLVWPLPLPSPEQLDEARQCGLIVIEFVDRDAFEPQTACEWMALAIAHLADVTENEPAPELALEAYRQAVLLNPAFPLRWDVLMPFWGRLEDVLPTPDFIVQPVVLVEVSYDFAGTTHYELTIEREDEEEARYIAHAEVLHTPIMEDPIEYDFHDKPLDAVLIEELAAGIRDLIPIEQTFTDQPCWHIISDWTVRLVFEDEQEVIMRTYASNALSAGGPWQTTIDDQSYFQVSAAFLMGVLNIHDALEMPWGEVMSYGCGSSYSPLEMGFDLTEIE